MNITFFKGHWYNLATLKPCSPLTPGAVPSVTTILSVLANPHLEAWRHSVGLEIANKRSTEAAERGTMIHKLLENIVEGAKIPEDHVYAKEGQGYVNWASKHTPTDCEAETIVGSEKFEYAGQIDLICRLDGALWIIDFKTSRLITPTFALQLRGYEQALFETRGEHARTAVLQITDDRNPVKAGFRFEEVDAPISAFLACKTLFDWQRSNKRKAGAREEIFDGTYIRTA